MTQPLPPGKLKKLVNKNATKVLQKNKKRVTPDFFRIMKL
jgi:hypothetical protein